MAEIEKLIERLEKLTGPCRGVDKDIHLEVFTQITLPDCPAYTKSIDCALTLAPEGVRANITTPDPSMKNIGPATALLIPYNSNDALWARSRAGNIGEGEHATSPAVALCIAALKARAALEKDAENEG